MDVHPTPFPGKRRSVAANPAKKDGERLKPSTQQSNQIKQKPKRAFGIPRSTNVPAEKPAAKPSKPEKSQGNGTQKPSNERKTKAGGEKKQHVAFQEPAEEAAAANTVDSDVNLQDGGVTTPVSSLIKAAAAATPYQTAENCSKCRFDKLEMAAYWLAHIKIAEAGRKHFVSAAFFRLAFDCHAEPLPSLQSELKHYVARHKSDTLEAVWGDLCQVYGISNELYHADLLELDQLDAVLVEPVTSEPSKDVLDSKAVEEGCLEFDIVEDHPLDAAKETIKNVDADHKDEVPFKNENDGLDPSHEKPKPLMSSSHSSKAQRTTKSGDSEAKGCKVSGGRPASRLDLTVAGGIKFTGREVAHFE